MRKSDSKIKNKLLTFALWGASSLFAFGLGASIITVIVSKTNLLNRNSASVVANAENGTLVYYNPSSPFSDTGNWSSDYTVTSGGETVNVTATDWISYEDYAVKLSDGSEKHFFSKDELIKLHYILLDRLAYGPEIYTLKRISFNNSDFVTSEANGQYYPATNEIFINTKSFVDKNLTFYQRVELVLSTIYHEYFHHFANMYMQNDGLVNKAYNTTLSNKTVSGTNITKVNSYWNTQFLESFQSALNFSNNDTNNSYISNGASTCFCSVFAASVLYHMANDTSQASDEQLLGVDTTLNGGTYSSNPSDSTRQSAATYDASRFAYYFSQSELIPREFDKIGYVPLYNSSNPGSSVQNGFGTSTSGTSSSNTYFEDQVRSAYVYQWPRNSSRPYLSYSSNYFNYTSANLQIQYSSANNVYAGSMSLKNAITDEDGNEVTSVAFDSRVADLYNAYLSVMGYGNEVSQLYFVNKAEVTKASSGTISSYTSGTSENMTFTNLVLVSGFLSKENAAKYDGLVIVNGSSYQKLAISYLNNASVNTNENILNTNAISASKSQVLDSTTNLLSDGELTFKAKESLYDTTKTLNPVNSNYTLGDSSFSSELVSYMSDAIDLQNFSTTMKLKFWDDLNGNNEVEANELYNPVVSSANNRAINSYRAYFGVSNKVGGKTNYSISLSGDEVQINKTNWS